MKPRRVRRTIEPFNNKNTEEPDEPTLDEFRLAVLFDEDDAASFDDQIAMMALVHPKKGDNK